MHVECTRDGGIHGQTIVSLASLKVTLKSNIDQLELLMFSILT